MDNIADPGNSDGDEGEDIEFEKPQITQKLDAVTVTQMKEIEVQKIQDDLTIKMAKREYVEIKRSLIYKNKKLESAKNRISVHTSKITELSETQKELIKKFHELKVYQNEIISTDLNSQETTYNECKDNNRELSSMMQKVFEKENELKQLKIAADTKKKEVNDKTYDQLTLNRETINDRLEKLTQSRFKTDTYQEQLKAKKFSSSSRQTLMKDKNERIIKLESDKKKLFDKLSLEYENLLKQKNDKTNELNNLKNNNKANEDLAKSLKVEIASSEEKNSKLRSVLEKKINEKEEILKQIVKKRQLMQNTINTSKENIENIISETNKAKFEYKTINDEFIKKEENLHKELNSLHLKCEERKKLIKKLEIQDKEYTKLKQSRQVKEKEIQSIDGDLKDKLKKFSYELEINEQDLATSLGKQKDYNYKIKVLEEDVKNIKKKLEQKNSEEEVILNKTDNVDQIQGLETSKKVSQLSNTFKKVLNVEEKNLELSTKNTDVQSSNSNYSQVTQAHNDKASPKKFEFDYNFSSNENFSDNKLQNNVSISFYESESEKLFEEMLTQNNDTSKKTDDKDVFKIPHAYATPMRKKSTYSRKY